MCSLVEIKNHGEIYIHYLSGQQSKNVTSDLSDPVRGPDPQEDISIIHSNQSNSGKITVKIDKMASLEDPTSDRASSMESSVGMEDNSECLDSTDSPGEDTSSLVTVNVVKSGDSKDEKKVIGDVHKTDGNKGRSDFINIIYLFQFSFF